MSVGRQGDDDTMQTIGSVPQPHGFRPATAQKVVIVNGRPDVLELVESVLEAGHYDVVFVESNAHAYSQVKRVQPNLVILCIGANPVDGFQVLSMLKLDPDTRGIPVLTYSAEYEGQPVDAREEDESSDEELFTVRPAPLMN
jgi:CheY-like chemotaxis protein